jgi:tetratricopeptide (TPR) repeat protein
MNTRMPLLMVALLACSSCHAENNQACEQSLRDLDSKLSTVAGNTDPKLEWRQLLDAGIARVQAECKTEETTTGLLLAAAQKMKGDYHAAGEAYRTIKPKSTKEEELVSFRAAELFIEAGSRAKAEPFLRRLETVSQNHWMVETARAQFECKFGRCGTQLERLQALSRDQPTVVGYNALLGYAYADRHEFEKAADQFDVVLATDVSALDSITALIAVASYANTNQRDKARRVYESFAKSHEEVVGVNERNFANMRAILEDTSGNLILFSEWPPPR